VTLFGVNYTSFHGFERVRETQKYLICHLNSRDRVKEVFGSETLVRAVNRTMDDNVELNIEVLPRVALYKRSDHKKREILHL